MLVYIGPETLIPTASILTGVAGVLLLFWRRMKSAAGTIVDWVRDHGGIEAGGGAGTD